MSEQPLQEFSVYNRADLEDLAWELKSSEGQFSLVLARCNYISLRDRLIEDLQQLSAFTICILVLPATETALYTRIQEALKEDPPGALMVVGLETVADLERLLSTANQVREEFRKHCPFPIVLWATDDVLKGLIHAAPDLESWATKTYFTLPPAALLQALQQAAARLFERLLSPGSSQSFEQLRQKLALDFLQRDEVRMAVQDLQRQAQVLEPPLQAALDFARGLNAIDQKEALEHFQRSLHVWQTIQAKAPTTNTPTDQLKRGLLLFYIGQTTYQLCEQEKEPHWEAARVPLQQCMEVFEQENRPDLVSKCITLWEKVLWQLQRWNELEAVATKALKLHQTAIDSHLPYASLSRLAQAYGFLADVALQRQQWTTAAQLAQIALNVLEQHAGAIEWVQSLQSRYLLLLAQAERELGQLKAAEAHLLEAKSLGDRGQPQTYLSILQALRELYLDAKDYAKAFAVKQERFSIEQQYGIRAFIGAGRLQPSKQAVGSDDRTVSQGMVAPEIAAAGRQQDLARLLERVERRDYRFVVIHGSSGVGKSSLVNAGLVPTLKQKTIEARGNVPIVMQVYTQWLQELGRLLAEATGEPLLETQPFTAQTLLEALRQLDQRNLRTVLIFDQFEEFFFVYPKPENRKPFFDFLVQCLQILSLKVFLSLREDYLHYLLECSRLEGMKRTGIDVLSQQVLYGLGNFDPQDAKAIIQSLTERARFFLEPALVDQLVEDLAREVGTVRPIELQVVGAQLQAENMTTLLQYHDCGPEPKQELVKRYLNGVVADCGAEHEPVAELVLFLLTDEKGTRPLKTRAELEKELHALAANTDESKHSLDLVLQIFVDSGLVFLLPEFPADRYQLVHDYLATFIREQQEDKLNELMMELTKEREQRRLSDEQRRRSDEQKKLSDEKLNRVLKRALTGSIAVGLGLAGLVAFAFVVAQQAEAQRKRAEISEINALNTSSEALFTSGRTFEALMESLRAAERLTGVDTATAVDSRVRTAAVLQQAVSAVQEHNSLEKHSAPVTSVSFSPDGKMLVSASADTTIKLWTLDGKVLQTLRGHSAYVTSVSFSPDGKTLSSASDDGTIKLWTLDGKVLQTLKGHSTAVTSVSFSPNGKTLVSGSISGIIKLWTLDGKVLQTLKGHSTAVTSVSFSPDSKMLASASSDKTIKLWTLDGKVLQTLRGHSGYVRSVSFSPDGKMLASTSADKTIKLWTLDGKVLQTLRGHSEPVSSVSFSPDSKMLVSASADKTIKLWTLDGKVLQTLRGHGSYVTSVSFSPDGKTLASASIDETIKLWTLDSKVLQMFKGHSELVNSVSFSPDGKTLASASLDETIKLWTLDGKVLQTLRGHSGYVRSVSFSPDGKTLASASADKTIKLWTLNGKILQTLRGHSEPVSSVSFSPDSKMLASASSDKTIKLWTLDGKVLQTLRGHSGYVRSVSFSPDGKMLASTSEDKTIKLWTLDGKVLQTLRGHGEFVNSVSFSPDSKMLASASADKTIKLWTLDGKVLQTLEGHGDYVRSVSFSPDGKMLASASVDKTIKLWTLDGKILQTLEGHSDHVRSVSFSPDGKILASASGDKTIKLWNLDLNNLLAQSCHWLHDYMAIHPEALEALKQCQTKPLLLAAAPAVVDEGEDLARKGNVQPALAKFRQALVWNPDLNLEPATRAQQLAKQGEAERLVDEGKNLGQEGNFEESLNRFQAASRLDPSLKLDPASEVKKLVPLALLSQMASFSAEHKFQEAMTAYTKAITLEPDVTLSSDALNDLCWKASLGGFAKAVLPVCEKAVLLSPNNASIRDSRGLARALTGNTKGAIEDFQALIAQTNDKQKQLQRQRWVKALSAGKNPFTPKELKSIAG